MIQEVITLHKDAQKEVDFYITRMEKALARKDGADAELYQVQALVHGKYESELRKIIERNANAGN